MANTYEKYWFSKYTFGSLGKIQNGRQNNVFLNNSRTNEQIFKIPTAYDHYGRYSHVKNFGSQNLLPVCSGKFKMAVEMCKMGFPFRIERVTTSTE